MRDVMEAHAMPFSTRVNHSWRYLVLALVLPCAAASPAAGPWEATHFTSDGPIVIDSDLVAPPGASLVLHAPHVVVLPGVTLKAGDGAPGADARSGAVAIAADGGAGGDIIIRAETIDFRGFAIAGDGGPGGNAWATGSPAVAKAGDGGRGGRVFGVPAGRYQEGVPGDGGNATAIGIDGACGDEGHDATRRGRHGSLPGEAGEDANATATSGANGCRPGDDGRDGGSAYAFAGDGNGNGASPGRPGDAKAIAGDGGDAHPGGCGPEFPPGGNGGDGGDAFAQAGNISVGAYMFPDHPGGTATAIAGQGGAGGAGETQGRGGAGGNANAFGGNVTAVGMTGGADGGNAFGVSGAGGGGAGGCPVGEVPFAPLGLVLLGALVTARLLARRARSA